MRRRCFQSILRLKRISDGSLKPGSFEVKQSIEQGFYFLVEAEEELFNGLRNPKSFEHRNSIYAMALAQGLQILHDEYKDQESWMEYQNLRLLYQMLKSQECPPLGTMKPSRLIRSPQSFIRTTSNWLKTTKLGLRPVFSMRSITRTDFPLFSSADLTRRRHSLIKQTEAGRRGNP